MVQFENILFVIIILISIIYTVKKGRKNNDLKDAVRSIIFGFSTILTFYIMLSFYGEFNLLAIKILNLIFDKSIIYNGPLHIVVIVILFIALKFTLQLILMIIQSFALSNVVNKIKHRKAFVTIFSFIFGAIRGAIIIVLLFIPLVLYNNLAESSNKIEAFTDTNVYKKLELLIDKNQLEVATDGIKENMENKNISYYNGTTIEEATASNDEIKNKAIEITENEGNDIQKAKAIYVWIGSNIKYDDNKASKIMSNDYSMQSGAIAAYDNRSGICFDYASLFCVMCKEIGLSTKMVIGNADNGKEYVSHCWNKVYLNDEKKWVNVDTVYYEVGNYFSENEFTKDHKIEKEIDI